MSLDEAEKWASQVINELFKKDSSSNLKHSQVISYENINNKRNGQDLSFSYKDFDASDLKSSKCYDTEKMCECDSTLLTLHGALEPDDGGPKSPTGFHYGDDLSIDNNQSLLTTCITTDKDSFSISNIEISNQKHFLFDSSSPVPVHKFEDIKIIEDLISDMLSITETSLDIINADVPENDSLKCDAANVVYSESLESNSFETSSLTEKSEDGGEEENSVFKKFLNRKLDEKDSLNFRIIEEQMKTLEFDDCYKEIDMSVDEEKCKKSQSLKEFHFNRFLENFVKEEMEYRWERYDPSVRRKYYQNQKPKAEIDDGFQHVKTPKKSSLKRQKSVAKIEHVVEVINNEQPSLRKGKSLKKVTFSDTCNEILPETSFEIFSNDFKEKCLNENAIRDETDKRPDIEENIRRNSFIRLQDVQQQQSTSLCDVDNDEVVFQRAARVITGYRNICIAIERFFVRPFALVIAECIDLIIFIFIMIFCLLYLFYENVIEKALNSSNAFELPFDKILKAKKKVIESGDDAGLNQMNPEGSTTEEFSENETSEFNFFAVFEDIDKNAVDLSTISFIDPTDVLKIASPDAKQLNQNFEMTFQKGCDFIESFKKKQQTAVVTSNENCLVDAILKDELNENYFDTEIIASSRTLNCKHWESTDSSPFKAFKQARSSEIPRENEKTAYASILHMKMSEDSPFNFKPSVFCQEEYILNSTAVDDSNPIAESASRNSNNFKNVLSSSCVNLSCIDKNQSPLYDKLFLNSSMNVNVPSFCSRSEGDSQNNSCSMPSLASDAYDKTTDSIIDTNNDESEKRIEEANGDKASSVVNHISDDSENIRNIEIGDSKRVSFGDKNKTVFGKMSPKSLKTKLPKKLTAICQQELEYADDLFASNISFDDQHNSYSQFENLDDASEFVVKPSTGNSSSELDTLMEPSVSPCENKLHKRKSSVNLRRRMSSMFNNMKNMQMMQCVSSINAKGKGYPSMKIIKKYKKHLEKP